MSKHVLIVLSMIFLGCDSKERIRTPTEKVESTKVSGQPIVDRRPEITNSIGMKLALIPSGKFTMGSPRNEQDRTRDELQHEVVLSKDYYLGVTEVTQYQFREVMDTNPSFFQDERIHGNTANHPVEQVTWKDAVEFCRRLSALSEERKAGRAYRLPTEAEWEYACRAGTKTAYHFGDDRKFLSEYAWYGSNSKGQTQPVQEKKPNAWGLCDMHGNVSEWCSDWEGAYSGDQVTDPVGPENGSRRIIRGGSWDVDGPFFRSAFRGVLTMPKSIGFRVVATVEVQE